MLVDSLLSPLNYLKVKTKLVCYLTILQCLIMKRALVDLLMVFNH